MNAMGPADAVTRATSATPIRIAASLTQSGRDPSDPAASSPSSSTRSAGESAIAGMSNARNTAAAGASVATVRPLSEPLPQTAAVSCSPVLALSMR